MVSKWFEPAVMHQNVQFVFCKILRQSIQPSGNTRSSLHQTKYFLILDDPIEFPKTGPKSIYLLLTLTKAVRCAFTLSHIHILVAHPPRRSQIFRRRARSRAQSTSLVSTIQIHILDLVKFELSNAVAFKQTRSFSLFAIRVLDLFVAMRLVGWRGARVLFPFVCAKDCSFSLLSFAKRFAFYR